jgi:hypothetical protein
VIERRGFINRLLVSFNVLVACLFVIMALANVEFLPGSLLPMIFMISAALIFLLSAYGLWRRPRILKWPTFLAGLAWLFAFQNILCATLFLSPKAQSSRDLTEPRLLLSDIANRIIHAPEAMILSLVSLVVGILIVKSVVDGWSKEEPCEIGRST